MDAFRGTLPGSNGSIEVEAVEEVLEEEEMEEEEMEEEELERGRTSTASNPWENAMEG